MKAPLTQKTSNLTLDFAKYPESLMPTIAQDADTGAILMVGFANPEALNESRKSGLATFWSRSRNELWTKGLTSGDTLEILDIFTDCDNDTLIYLVKMNGNGACHIDGWTTCFRRRVDQITGQIIPTPMDLPTWSRVLDDEEKMIQGKQFDDPDNSSTAKALQGKVSRIAQKVGEEGVEVTLAFMDLINSLQLLEAVTKTSKNTSEIVNGENPNLINSTILENKNLLIGEVADLMYRLQILLVKADIPWKSVELEIIRRRK